MVPSVAACCVPPTAQALLFTVNGDDSAVFRFFCSRWRWPLTFELGRDFCTVRLTAKLRHPTCSRSEVIVRTNTLTNWQTNRRRWTYPPRFATLRRLVKSCLKA